MSIDEFFLPRRLHLITGCMFAGKTKTLLNFIAECRARQKNIQVFKAKIDFRYDPLRVVSHEQQSVPAVVIDDIAEIWQHINEHTDVVAIDELQFFALEIIPLIARLLDRGIIVCATVLATDFRKVPFKIIQQVLDSVPTVLTKLFATCDVCGAPAQWTQRLVDDQPAHRHDPVILMPTTQNKVTYTVRCTKHHILL